MQTDIQECAEFRRIRDLPWRERTEDEDRALATFFESVLARDPSARLRPVQARALAEVVECGGGLLPLRVGAGKTLVSLLSPTVLHSNNALLVIPAKLREKTFHEWAEYSKAWRCATRLQIVSYEQLSRVTFEDFLERLHPDLIILDEAHRAKNTKAACTRRLKRYITERRKYHTVRVVVMSGTVTRKNLQDFAHLADWALRGNAPVPTEHLPLSRWSEVLDARGDSLEEIPHAGALRAWLDISARVEVLRAAGIDEQLARALQAPTRAELREGFRRRMSATPGVISTRDEGPPCSLTVSPWTPPVPAAIGKALKALDDSATLPDGHPLTDGPAIYAAERTIALGFWYRWKVAPPAVWLEARRNWARFTRETIRYSKLDTEFAVVSALRRGEIREPTVKDFVEGDALREADTALLLRDYANLGVLSAWQYLRESFTPESEPIWITDEIAQSVATWVREEKGIAWVEHVAFGNRLADLGVPYYGAGGTFGKTPIERADSSQGLAASVASNSEGRNLQAWSSNLVTAPLPAGAAWEQLLGRTHRDGQEADEVTVDVAMICPGHFRAWTDARRHAWYLQQTMGQPQKLLLATDHITPSLIERANGHTVSSASANVRTI